MNMRTLYAITIVWIAIIQVLTWIHKQVKTTGNTNSMWIELLSDPVVYIVQNKHVICINLHIVS